MWLRYGSLCKALNVLPRGGGVLDQPSGEMLRLERVLSAFDAYEEKERSRRKSWQRTRGDK